MAEVMGSGSDSVNTFLKSQLNGSNSGAPLPRKQINLQRREEKCIFIVCWVHC